MGATAIETISFDGYASRLNVKDFGVEEWAETPVHIISTASAMSKSGSVAYMLPTTYSGLARKILNAEIQLKVWTGSNGSEPATMFLAPLAEEMSSASISGKAPPPAIGNKYLTTWPVSTMNAVVPLDQAVTSFEDCKQICNNGFRISVDNLPDGATAFFISPNMGGGVAFKMEVEYVEPEVWGYGPSGWINVSKENRFFWSMRYPTTDVLGTLAQKAATFQWKDGNDGQIHEVKLTTQTEYVVPANTFPESENLLWRVILTADNGEVSSNMEWTKLSAFDSIPVLKPKAPVGEYIEARGSVRFAWSYSIETGSKQTAYEVQIKSDSMDWKTIASGQGDASEILVGAELIPAGTLQWRVRGANFDGVFSEWSTPATFVAIAAPTMPSLRVVEATPRPVIAWQGAGQQGYEAEIGDYYSGVVYGTKKEAKSRLYLPDGTVRARVRIVNEFGLWSEWAEIEFQVANEPIAGNVVLKTQGGTDAILSWNVLTDADAYLVYRNGKLIGTTKNGTYKDRLFLGTADYFVRAVQNGSDFYVDSNASTVETKTEHVLISKYGGEWIDLEYSLTATPSVQTTTNSEVTLMRYMGRTYPMPEYSPQKSRLYKLNVAFKDMLEAVAFEALLGELVVVKDQYGNFVVGVMESVQKTQTVFFTSFSTTISQVDEAAYYEET